MHKIIPASELTALADEQFAAMVLFARQWLPAGAEDVVQSAFLALVKENIEKKAPNNPVAWLYRVIRNEAVSQWRAEQRRKVREGAVAKPDLQFEAIGPSILEATDVGDSFERLEGPQREVVFLRIWAGLSFEEIAQTTGKSRSGVFRLYREGLETMKKELTK